MNFQSGICKTGSSSSGGGGPTGGETFTVTCYACGMPSSKEWAQRVRSRSHPGCQEPFYPFLNEMTSCSPPGSVFMEDGSTYLCAFCNALLESQWDKYETKGDFFSPADRKYNIHKFICAVCGVETYRKRVRALPFQEFPFLVKQRQPGSITLGNNPLAVVCLDCSETLWAQSAEYDRWGLPIHKRHFNWMARPPPPEDSVEATVARLPSGETQLPRCPPTDPLVPPRTNEPSALPETILPVKSNRQKSSSGFKQDSSSIFPSFPHGSGSMKTLTQQQQSHRSQTIKIPQPTRKTSLSTAPGTASSIDAAHSPHSQPPIVTVAPMSTQQTLTNVRKDTMYPQMSPSTSTQHQHKHDSHTQVGPSVSSTGYGGTQGTHPSVIYNQAYMNPGYPGAFSWASTLPRDGPSVGNLTSHPFGPFGGNPMTESLPSPSGWPWLPPTSPELLRYQSYISSLHNRGLNEAYYGSPASFYPPTSITSTSQYVPHMQGMRSSIPTSLQLQTDVGAALNQHVIPAAQSTPPSLERSSPIASASGSAVNSYQHKLSRSDYHEKKSSSEDLRTSGVKVSKPNVHNDDMGENSRKKSDSPKIFSSSRSPDHQSKPKRSSVNKHYTSRKTKSEKGEILLPKKRYWQPPENDELVEKVNSHASKKLHCSASGTDQEASNTISIPTQVSEVAKIKKDNVDFKDLAMDLSVPSVTPRPRTFSCPASSKFSIAFLSKSEPSCMEPTAIMNASDRTSVIVPILSSKPDLKNVQMNTEETLLATTVLDVIPVTERFEDGMETDEKEDVKVTTATGSPKFIEDSSAVKDEDETTKDADTKKTDTQSDADSEETLKNDDAKVETETEIHLLTINEIQLNPADFVRKTIDDYICNEKLVKLSKKEDFKQQLNFLSQLGLITPDKKFELELESLAIKNEKFPFPPLKLIVQSPPLPKVDEELERQLLEVAFDDPSLKQGSPPPEKSSFLQNLGLKPCTKSEKSRREVEWRLVLTERMMREKRNEKLRGIKRPWDTYNRVSKLLSLPKKDLSVATNFELFTSLSVSLPVETEPINHRRNSADLLTTVEANQSNKCFRNTGTCINYPKYVPSYVLTAQSKASEPVEAIHHKEVLSNGIGSLHIAGAISLHEPILKIPVINPNPLLEMASARRRSSNSTVLTTSDDSDIEDACAEECNSIDSRHIMMTKSSEIEPTDWNEVEDILKASNFQWEKTKKVMEKVLEETDPSTSKENKRILEQEAKQLKVIRKHLKAQQADMRHAEKLFKTKEKQIMKKLKLFTKYSNPKDTKTVNSTQS